MLSPNKLFVQVRGRTMQISLEDSSHIACASCIQKAYLIFTVLALEEKVLFPVDYEPNKRRDCSRSLHYPDPKLKFGHLSWVY
jgi:hypothetical protein